MKTLKFKPKLAEQIREGTKTATWRLFDDKDLQEGDVIELWENGAQAPFANASIVLVVEKTLGTLTEEDWTGHERYANDAAMYEEYRRYYGSKVGPQTSVKIIQFAVLESPKTTA